MPGIISTDCYLCIPPYTFQRKWYLLDIEKKYWTVWNEGGKVTVNTHLRRVRRVTIVSAALSSWIKNRRSCFRDFPPVFFFFNFYHHFMIFVSASKATSKKTVYKMYNRTVYTLVARNPDAIMKNIDVKRLITRPVARTNWRLSVLNWSWKTEEKKLYRLKKRDEHVV